MPVTFQVVGNLADFGDDPRAGVKVRATATPGVKVGDVAVHSNEPETAVTDASGDFTLTLVSLVGVWYRIQTPYANAIPTVNLAGYTPDGEDPTTGTVFPADTVIDLVDVVDEDPTPGYDAIAYVGGEGGAVLSVNGDTGVVVLTAADVGAATTAALTAEESARIAADSALDVRVDALEEAPGGGVTDHGALTGLADDDHTQYALADGSRGTFAPVLGADDNYVTDAEKVKLSNLSGTNTGDQTLPTWSTISGKPAVVGAGATQADARTAIGAGTSSFSGVYADLSSKPTLGTAAATASTDYATAAQGVLAGTALQPTTGQAINAQTGTSYTLVAGDAGKVVTLSNAGAITLNAPGSVFTAGQRVDVVVIGAGMATVVGTSGATANGTPSLVSRAQWSAFTILWTSATACVVIGDMA